MPVFKKIQEPEIKSSTIVFDSFFKIRKDALISIHNDQPYDYYSLDAKAPAISILARTKEGAFVINHEYRHPTSSFLLSCPGGYIDDKETPEEASARELLEETGYAAEKFFLMGSAFPYPGISSQKIFYVGAIGAEKIKKPSLERGEVLTTQLLTLEEIHQWIKEEKPLDGILCAALFFFENAKYF